MWRRSGLGIVALLLAVSAPGATLRVPADHPSIQGAIDAALDGDLVLISPGTYTEWEIDFLGKAITVSGTDPSDPAVVDSTVVDGSENGSVFVLRSGEGRGTRLAGVTVMRGKADLGSGISCIDVSPTIIACAIRNNDSWGALAPMGRCGGGVYCERGAPLFIDCRILENWTRTGNDISNTSDAHGGGVCIRDGTPVFVGCEIRDNHAGGFTYQPARAAGGGVFLGAAADAVFLDCAIVDNDADADYTFGGVGRGGGIFGLRSSLDLIRCEISGNSIGRRGLIGGVEFYGKRLRLIGCNISDNACSGIVARTSTLEVEDTVVRGHSGPGSDDDLGGGIDWDGDQARIANSDILNNTTQSCGGGLRLRGPALVDSCTVRGNVGNEFGGGLCVEGVVTIRSSLIDSNRVGVWPAPSGGAIYVAAGGSIGLEDCTLSFNWSPYKGGGVYTEGIGATLVDCRLRGNGAGHGGAAYLAEGSLLMSNCETRANTSASGGSVIHAAAGTLTTEATLITENMAHGWGLDGAAIEVGGCLATLRNCTITTNTAEDAMILVQDKGAATITNCIIWNNDAPETIRADSAAVQIRYSTVNGGWPGIGNIDADPLFRALGPYNYLLRAGSPAIDAGDPELSDAIFDWHPRWPAWQPDGERSDMGAYGGPANRGWLP